MLNQPKKKKKYLKRKTVSAVDAETQKKLKLKEHLAMCRVKSAAVRKAKADEKKKNKRPVGRPKKQKLPVDEPKHEIVQPLDTIQETAEDKTEEEIFKSKEPAKLIQVLETPKLIPTPEAPPPQPNPTPSAGFDMDMLLNKMDERMNEKLKKFHTPVGQPYTTATPTRCYGY